MSNTVRKPRIGVNVENKPAYNGVSEFHFLESGYVDALVRAGAIPRLLPPVDQLDLVPEMLDDLDAFLLVGGPDLDPRKDGYRLHESVRLMSPRREDFDRALVDEIESRRMPVFGIGVGMQLLNVSQGGTLFLHLPEDLPNALPHRETYGDSSQQSLRHSVIIEKGSLLDSVYGENDVRVNSRHHMAIDDLAPGFLVTARCPADGVIEAIESTQSDWFALGVQFHPEARSATFLDQRIFDAFVDGVREFMSTGVNKYAVRPQTRKSRKRRARPNVEQLSFDDIKDMLNDATKN